MFKITVPDSFGNNGTLDQQKLTEMGTAVSAIEGIEVKVSGPITPTPNIYVYLLLSSDGYNFKAHVRDYRRNPDLKSRGIQIEGAQKADEVFRTIMSYF